MRTNRIVIAVLVTLCSLALAPQLLWAEAGDRRFQFGFLYSMPTGDLVQAGETFEDSSIPDLRPFEIK